VNLWIFHIFLQDTKNNIPNSKITSSYIKKKGNAYFENCNITNAKRWTKGLGWGDLRQRDHMEDLAVDARKILKWIFKKWAVGHGLNSSGLG
jgi:hypothetical protein